MLRALVVLVVVGVIAQVAIAKTDCEEARDREMQSNAPLPMRLIPKCEDNGDYAGLQCFNDSKFCACWTKTGDPITQPSTQLKSCKCLRERYRVEKANLIGSYAPQCEPDGSYDKMQCWGSTGQCFCVDTMTGRKTSEVTRGDLNCP
ncbi:u33-Liphistoxin-Lm1b_1 [Caerostris darwini]|uniref:U33-Liphistoxin-Lm1b_1 n=1 Tax=Caerostris darwini TaxID=1538125 RepID=A0AAV4UR33_9ARAC|nr:u33-Liphistoxin-Lm1b_1 [Caerostris darwini]